MNADFKAAHRHFWRELCALPLIPTISVSEWARKHRRIPRGHAHKSGDFEPYPMQVAPMDDANDPNVSEIVICWAAQTAGKSELMFTVLGYFIHADPSPQMYVQPTDQLAKDYSKERVGPMIRDMPVLAELVRPARSRDSGNTTLSKTYPGGSLSFAGANAPAGLAGKPRRVILLDEIDRYPASAGKEGDPCALADKRAEAFPNAVKYKTSTPTIKGRSRIWGLLDQSDCQKWHARCPHCQAEQVFAWSQVKWPEGKPEEARLKCSACEAELTDAERVEAVKAGRWKATQPFAGIRGYWLNGINTLLPAHKGFANRLHEMAAEFLKAKKEGKEAMKVWINTFLAECYEEEAEATVSDGELIERAEDYAPDAMPNDVLLLAGAVDVQGDRLECEIVGYGRDAESWGIEKKVFDGDPDKDEVWRNLDNYLLVEFTREDGLPMHVEKVFVDMQAKTKRVLDFCRPRLTRGVYPCRGVNRVGPVVPPLLPAKPSRNNRARIPHWNVGVTVAKSTIYDRLELPLPGPRAMHFPKGYGYTADHFRQLTAEKRRTRYAHGVAYSIFEKDNAHVRNEALDLRVYALAALESIGPIRWDKLAENRLANVPVKSEGEEPEDEGKEFVLAGPEPTPEPEAQPEAPKPRVRPKMQRRNWATSW